MRKIRTSPRYLLSITRTDFFSLGEIGGGGGIGEISKKEVFLTYERVIRS